MNESAGTKRRKGDMTEGSIYGALVLFAIPTFLTSLLNQFYNMADSIIVGQFVGANALAAVGANSTVTMLMTALFQGAAIGGSVYIAQLFGARRNEELGRAFNTMYVLTALIGAACGVLGIVFGGPIMRALNTPENIFDDALAYFRITCGCLPALAIYMAGSSALRSVGDTRAPLYFLICTAVLNVGLNLLFVIGLHAGVNGVGWATFIAQYCSAALVLWRTGHTRFCAVSISPRTLRLDAGMSKIIMKLGIPSAIQMAVSSLGGMLVQSFVNLFGSAATAASTTIHRLDGFVGMPCNAVGSGLSVFFGQNLAARKQDRLHRATIFGTILCTAMTVALSIALYVFAEPACRIFTDDPEIIDMGSQMFRVLCFFYWATALNVVYNSIIRGAGDTRAVMVISMISVVVRVPLTWLLAIFPEPNVFANIYLAQGICNVLSFAMGLGYYISGRWKKKVVVTIDS